MPIGGWELVASFAEEVAAIAEPLRLSDHKRDQRLASAVRGWIVNMRKGVHSSGSADTADEGVSSNLKP